MLKEQLAKAEKDNERSMSKMSLMEKELRKVGGRTDFSDPEILSAAPDTYYKQKIKLLEEEVEELKRKLESQQQAEADQDLSWPITGFSIASRRQRGGARSKALESSELPEDQQQQSMDSKRQIALIEQEAVVLRQRVSDLETENEKLSDEKRKLELQKKPGKAADAGKFPASKQDRELREKMEQMQKDIDRFIARIAELEKEKEVLGKDVDRRKKLEAIKTANGSNDSPGKFNVRLATMSELKEKTTELLKQNGKAFTLKGA